MGEKTIDANALGHGVPGEARIEIQRDLQDCIDAYPGLFQQAPKAPDPALLALPIAFGAPGHTASQLRTAARTSLWIFAVDWRIDHQAASATAVTDIVDLMTDVGDGGPAREGDDLARFLGALRADIATAPAFDRLGDVWSAELRGMLTAMQREFCWKQRLGMAGAPGSAPPSAGSRPLAQITFLTLDEYLDNADNFGSTWVNVAHWIRLGDPTVLAQLDELREASRLVQRALRLLNDLATHGREVDWRDLNALVLCEPHEIQARIDDLEQQAHATLERLRRTCPHGAGYLLQQLNFSHSFYSHGKDYWV